MYPIMMNIKNKPIAVIGGGKVAARKINSLLKEGAVVKVVSPALHETIDESQISWCKKKYEAKDIKGAALIFACTNDEQVNEQVLADAADCQWVNVTSNKQISAFYNMATTQVDGLSVSVSTGGASPARAKAIRQQLESYLENMEG